MTSDPLPCAALADLRASIAAVEARALARAALIEAGRPAGGNAATWADCAGLVLAGAMEDARLVLREDVDQMAATALAATAEIVADALSQGTDDATAQARLDRVLDQVVHLPIARRRLAVWIAAREELECYPVPAAVQQREAGRESALGVVHG